MFLRSVINQRKLFIKWHITASACHVCIVDQWNNTVRFFYKLLSGPNTDEFPWERIWCENVPKQVSFFLWTAANDRILTIDNLVKRGRSLVNRCCLYCCDGESVDYLLLHYKFYHTLWCKAFAVFGIQWVMPRSVSFFFLYGEKLVWKTSYNHLESGLRMFNMVSVAGTQYPHFWRQGENIRSPKISYRWYSISLGSYLAVYELYFFIRIFRFHFL